MNIIQRTWRKLMEPVNRALGALVIECGEAEIDLVEKAAGAMFQDPLDWAKETLLREARSVVLSGKVNLTKNPLPSSTAGSARPVDPDSPYSQALEAVDDNTTFVPNEAPVPAVPSQHRPQPLTAPARTSPAVTRSAAVPPVQEARLIKSAAIHPCKYNIRQAPPGVAVNECQGTCTAPEWRGGACRRNATNAKYCDKYQPKRPGIDPAGPNAFR